jgi:hypothetical protein
VWNGVGVSRGDPGEHYADALSYGLSLANRPAFTSYMIHAALMRDEVVLDYQRERGAERAAAFAWSIVDKAIERTVEHPVGVWKDEVPRRIERYRATADAAGLSPTDRRVAEGLYLTAFLTRSTTFHLAARTCALRVGLPAMTVSRSLKRLKARHLVRLQRKHTATIAALYRLQGVTRGLPPQGGSLVTVGVSLVDEWGFERRLLRHDAFRNSALGDLGWLVARRLSDEIALDPLKCPQLGTRGGVPHMLDTLEAAGAAQRTRRGWVRPLEPFFFAALDEIAHAAGTAGALERDRERYREERDRRDCGLEPSALFVTGRAPCEWWSAWWGSLSGEVVADAA